MSYRDYKELAGKILVDAYNSKGSTVETLAAGLQQLEKDIKREVAEQFIADFKELDAECKKCDDQNEEMYSWCDFSCILMNQILSILRNIGFTVNAMDQIQEIDYDAPKPESKPKKKNRRTN